MISPFRRFANGLHQLRGDFNEQADEMLAFAEIMAMKDNCLEYDNETGFYYVTSSGPIEHVIPVLTHLLDKLERIQKQKDNNH